jgi:hypothetical protein
VEGNGIMNPRPDTSLTQVFLKLFPVLNLDDIKVENRFRPGRLEGKLYYLGGRT